MAYCRFGVGDVYVYHNVHGYLECCACRLTKRKRYKVSQCVELELPNVPKTVLMYQNFTTTSRSEMIKHIKTHKKAGHKVTSQPISRLRQEIKELGDTIN